MRGAIGASQREALERACRAKLQLDVGDQVGREEHLQLHGGREAGRGCGDRDHPGLQLEAVAASRSCLADRQGLRRSGGNLFDGTDRDDRTLDGCGVVMTDTVVRTGDTARSVTSASVRRSSLGAGQRIPRLLRAACGMR